MTRSIRTLRTLDGARIVLWTLATVALPLSDHARASETRRLPQTPERRAVDAALQYIPASRDWEVVVIDPEFAADPAAIRALDAFTVREGAGFRKKVYLNRESRILQEAAKGVDFYVKVLAALLVHEAEHLKGGTESAARRAERQFIQDLMAHGVVPTEDGLRYLALLRLQPEGTNDRSDR
jgi:hypothetical protein